MNRTTVFLGAFLLAVAIALFAYPEFETGVETVDLEVQLAIFVFPAAIATVVWGAIAPDPRITTVGGMFGNADENELRRRLSRTPPNSPVRYRPSPLETVNCRKCYTVVPARLVDCPRCGTRRECRGCHKPLFFLSGAVRCAPCLKDEVYCSCPVQRRPVAGRRSGGRY